MDQSGPLQQSTDSEMLLAALSRVSRREPPVRTGQGRRWADGRGSRRQRHSTPEASCGNGPWFSLPEDCLPPFCSTIRFIDVIKLTLNQKTCWLLVPGVLLDRCHRQDNLEDKGWFATAQRKRLLASPFTADSKFIPPLLHLHPLVSVLSTLSE